MNQTNALFLDPALQKQFQEVGYVKVPLLTTAQADQLVELFGKTRSLHETVTTLHHTTTDTGNPELIKEVDAKVKDLFVPPLKNILHNFKPLAGCFHIKQSGSGSATGVHQDPTFVDEDNYVSANVWVALHDMNTTNGNLYFVPGSNTIPCLRITPSSPTYYNDFSEQLPQMAVQVPMKKGEAVIFNNATIHGATDNTGNNLRLAATLLICSAPADWLLYYRDENTPGDSIEKYKLDFDAFIGMAKNGRPDKGTFTELVDYNFPLMSMQEFVSATSHTQPAGPFRWLKNALRKLA